MNIEYEATFANISKKDVHSRLQKAGASLRRPEFLQKRVVFNLPRGHEIPGAWVRVRDEGDRITMSIKVVDGVQIENQKESLVVVNSFEESRQFLKYLGCEEKAYQETKREIWDLNNVEICIDEWPFLEPFVEIEGGSEQEVKNVAEQIGFDWESAKFCSVDTLYSEKYGFSEDVFSNRSPRVVFDMENPFVRK